MSRQVPGVGYIPQLDGLRAVAVWAVMVGHAWPDHVPGGGAGVALFFALSGYLITGLLVAERQEHGRIDYLRFYGRRAIRLVPAMALVVVAVQLVMPPGRETIFAAVFYYANWWRATGHDMGPLAHTWSLAIEEQFYLVWPLLLALAYAAREVRGVAAAAVIVSALAYVARWVHRDDPAWLYNGLDTRMDALMLGGLVALGVRSRRDLTARVCRWFVVPAVAVLLLHTFYNMVGGYQVALGMQAPACAIVVGWLVTAPGSAVVGALSGRVPVWFGRISYGLYLWHWPVLLLMGGWVPYWWRLPAHAVVAVLLAWGSFVLVERPVARWLRPYVMVPRSQAGQRLRGSQV